MNRPRAAPRVELGDQDVLQWSGGILELGPGVPRRAAAEAFDLDPARLTVPPLDGFSDQSQFSRHYKRLAGVTPGQFRRHARIA